MNRAAPRPCFCNISLYAKLLFMRNANTLQWTVDSVQWTTMCRLWRRILIISKGNTLAVNFPLSTVHSPLAAL